MTAIVNTFSKDLLDRVVLIQKDIDGIMFAFPRFWEPIGNNPYPGFYNRVTDITPNPQGGQPYKPRLYLVEMRLIVGPLSAGYRGEYEDAGNAVQSAVIDAFDAQQRLGHSPEDLTDNPTGPLGLRYVVSSFIQPVVGGVQPFDYTDFTQAQAPLFYLGIPYSLQVNAQFKVGRLS